MKTKLKISDGGLSWKDWDDFKARMETRVNRDFDYVYLIDVKLNEDDYAIFKEGVEPTVNFKVSKSHQPTIHSYVEIYTLNGNLPEDVKQYIHKNFYFNGEYNNGILVHNDGNTVGYNNNENLLFQEELYCPFQLELKNGLTVDIYSYDEICIGVSPKENVSSIDDVEEFIKNAEKLNKLVEQDGSGE